MLSLMVLLACSGSSDVPPDKPAEPTEAPAPATDGPAAEGADAEAIWHEAEPGHAGIIEMLGSNGACSKDGLEKPERAIEWPMGGVRIFAAICESYAYQSSFEWFIEDKAGMRPLVNDSGAPVRGLGNPSFATSTKTASWLEKARGPGDCGDWYKYELVTDHFGAAEHRSRACDDAADIDTLPPPSEWPLVASGPVVMDEAALVGLVPGTVKELTNELSGERAGVTIEREAAGAVAGVPCGKTVSAWIETWSCELTAPYSIDGYKLKAGGSVNIHYKTGHLSNVSFADVEGGHDGVVNGVPCGTYAHFSSGGELDGCTLAKSHTFPHGITLPAKTDVHAMDSQGNVREMVIYDPVTIAGKEVPAGTIELAANGSVSQVNADWFGD